MDYYNTTIELSPVIDDAEVVILEEADNVRAVLSTLFRATYMVLIALFGYHALTWLVDYIELYRRINKIAGVPTIPFIGNLHYVKSRKGAFRLYVFSDTYYLPPNSFVL